jgi:uncharacterized protein (TIGR03083 family)
VDRADLQAAITAERLRLADVLDDLGPAEWDVPSLCAGWTVKDVVAHMTLLTRLSRVVAFRGILAARFDVNRFIAEAARDRAAQYSPAELVSQFRASADSPRRPPGAKPMDPLVDILGHGQDITRPLHRTLAMPPEHVVPALEFAMSIGFYGAPKRLVGLRLVATDADWSTGEGDRELRGPVGDLLLVATGRPAGLAALEGAGVDEMTARLATH